jgi:hypothetical protein
LGTENKLIFLRKIECQIIASDGPAGECAEANSVTSYDEWSYSDLDPSSEFLRNSMAFNVE